MIIHNLNNFKFYILCELSSLLMNHKVQTVTLSLIRRRSDITESMVKGRF